MKISKHSDGSIIVSLLVMTLFLSTVIYGLIVLAGGNVSRARSRILLLQTQYAAESGVDAAIANFNASPLPYMGTSGNEIKVVDNSQYKATYSTTVSTSGSTQVIVSVGKLYSPATATAPTYTRTVRAVAQRSSTNTSTSILSRNIIDIESGVKTIKAVDIFLNGYMVLNKNTTDVIAENIVVGGKNTGSANCSIGGSGELVKPTTFTHAGQTKTKIVTAFNNCISPPGNTSNANFDVTANQTGISMIESTYIPWSQYMDNSYQNSPTGCSDWTTGTFPRSIPSTGNDKKTHYPSSGSDISNACGTSGDVNLGNGQYTIKNNVHIRANLCAASACTPKFYNPDSGSAGIKYIFVEGTVNFDSVQTVAGSGPIVIIAYGSDPASKTSVCPYGGSIYMGNNGNTSAPALYLLASNGICLNKTKYGSAPALGGLSGKNIFVSTNPGTPFDLELDPAFPTSSIPINLSWRVTSYQRL